MLYGVSGGLGWRWKLGPIFIRAFVKRNKSFILFAIFPFPAKYSNKVLDIGRIVLHFSRVIALDGESKAKIDIVEVQLVIVVKDILLKQL